VRRFENIIRKIGVDIMIIAGIFLMATMVLTVVNVFLRALRLGSVSGFYEITQLLMVVVTAGALGFTTIEKAHVIADVFVTRLPERIQGIIDSLTTILGLWFWGAIVWVSIMILPTSLKEYSQYLQIPFLPFRSLWMLCMIFICLALFVFLINSLRKVVSK
jgi:TRAP-type C4-dicarboxylate transport system permease small subunit